MPVWRLEDDCISKSAKLTLNYAGPNPLNVYNKIRTILMRTIGVKREHIWERDFRWDITADPRGFFIRMYVNKKMDARTAILFELIFQGKQPVDPNKNGTLTMGINARIYTDYSLDSTFQQSVFYRSLLRVWYMLFYNEVRRGMLDECGKLIDEVLMKVRSELGLETKGPA